MKRAAIYARVSSDQQEREETIDSQLAQLRALARQNQLTIMERNIYLDEGYSGDLLARPGLDRLRDDARDGLFDIVIVHCPDRLARRYAYQVVVIEELQKYGCEVDFVNRMIAQTPEDQMLLAMQGVIAEYERAKIMERTRRGRLYKLKSGVLVTTQAPYGYRWIHRQGTQRGRIEVVPENADIVRQIFHWAVDEGLSLLKIGDRLMERRVVAPKGGSRWGPSTIHKILANRAYIGEFCLNRIMAVEPKEPPREGTYRRKRKCASALRPPEEWIVVPGPALIDKELFDAAQRILAANKRFALRHTSIDNELLLRCLLRCGACGYSIVAHQTRSRRPKGTVFRYYLCNKRAHQRLYGDPTIRCPLEPLKADVLDDIVWKDLCELMSDPARVTQYAGIEDGTADGPLQSEIERLSRELDACELQLQRLLDAYQRGALEMSDLLTRRGQLDKRRTMLANERMAAEQALRNEHVRRALRQHLPQLVHQVQKGLRRADPQMRRRLVRLLIDRVIVQPNLDLEIHYVLPGRLPDPDDRGPRPSGDAPTKPPKARTGELSGDLGLHSQPQ